MEKRITEIIARCKAIDSLQAEIERKAELENQGAFSEDQRTEYSTLKAEYDTLIAEKKTLEDDAEMKASRAGRATELEPRVLARRTEPGSATPSKQPAQEESEREPASVRFSIPANVIRSVPRNFAGEVNGQSPQQRAYRFGMYCLAKMAHDLPGLYAHAFPDAVKFVNNYMGGVSNVAHGSNDGTTGGHVLVPQEFSSDLIVLREMFGVGRRLLKNVPMSTDVKHIPKRASGLTASFTGESDAASESNMTWSDVQLSTKKLTCLARMSRELSADAVIAVGDELAGEIAYAFANKEDECIFNGTGTSTYGGITGIRQALYTAAGSPTTTSAGGITVADGNNYSEITLANFNSVVGTLPAFADTPNAAWVVHKLFFHTVMQRLEMAVGGATGSEIKTGDRRPRPTFMGYPVEFAQVMPSTEGNTQVCALLGDFALGAVFGDRTGVEIRFSEHATVGGQSTFERDQIAVLGTERFDAVVHGVGNTTSAGPIVGLLTLNS